MTAPIEYLTFSRSAGGQLHIGPMALALLLLHRQHAEAAFEAGGVLLGRHILGSEDIIVDDVTQPLRGDRRGRHRFFRARDRRQAAIDRAWRESGGTCTYLGEWHTHPELAPVPSPHDWCDWRRRLRHDQFTEPISFLIVGTAEIRGWEGRHSGDITPLGTNTDMVA